MCGIVGAISQRNVAHILLDGLKRLEYRGYDSAGMAIIDPNKLNIQRRRILGKVAALESSLKDAPLLGHTGIAHTRWATHGQPSEANAHPQFSKNEIAIVHNGIIENYLELRKQLIAEGYEFTSDTDTEVIAHLIHYHYSKSKDMLTAIRQATTQLQGTYALGIIQKGNSENLYAVRCGSPLVVGIGIDENFIASDVIALQTVSQKFIFLEEGDIAQLTTDKVNIFDSKGEPATRHIQIPKNGMSLTSKGKYRHFMLKEIFEQPLAITDTIQGHIMNDRIVEQAFGHKAHDIFQKVDRIHIIACGTSYHAGLVGKYWLEELAGIPTQVEIASENRYRAAAIEENTLFVAISQSGETADTLAALRLAKEKGYFATLGICNISHSSLARETDALFLTRAGVEIGVAATKTFTTQLAALLLLTLALRQIRSSKNTEQFIQSILHLPKAIQDSLVIDSEIKQVAKQFTHKQHAIFLGRGIHYPIAMEGALKLKEISYLHAEAYPSGELKHGPLALVDENMPVIFIAPSNRLLDKIASNVQEVQARGGKIIVLSDVTEPWDQQQVQLIKMPKAPELLTPITYTIPLQLLTYHVAVLKGTDVDQPRNLAKSVTVE